MATIIQAMSIATKQNKFDTNGVSVENTQEDELEEAEAEPTYLLAGTIPKSRNLYEGPADRRGRTSWTTTYPDDIEDPPENAGSAQYALLIRNKKCYDGRKKLEIDSIVVQSALLKKILGVVLKDYPGITTNLERVEFKAPFQPFVHRWEQFAAAKEEETDADTLAHFNLLWDVLEEELRDLIHEKNDHVANGVVRFDNIWTIFEPDVLISSVDENHERIYKLQSSEFANTRCGRVYHLKNQFVDFDGENFGQGTESLTIPAFSKNAVKEKILARGRRFEELRGYHYKAYDGIAVGEGMFGPVRYSVNSRVIIDTYAFNRFNPNRKVHLDFLKADAGEPESEDDLDYVEANGSSNNSTIDAALSDEQLLITTPTLRGYSLKDKKWLSFYIDSVQEIVWNEHAFASLVAPAEQKELILAFAESQAKHKDQFDDVVQGKGRGIIMLISGPPGVGKTMTAESVAEAMKVPLYMMSAGDLGTNPAGVETALANILEMNTKWNAVLLLDEADVFLEARSAHDLERNKLVSIFLRLLEYYEGILFLTTNRVDNIDAAFESRIHLSLQYQELGKPSRKHVWQTFLARTKGASQFGDAEVDRLVEVPLNGRVIKNILKTAQLLASKQDVPLAFGHVDTVMRLKKANERKWL